MATRESRTKTNMARRGAAVEPPHEEQNALSYMQPEILPIQIMIDVLKEVLYNFTRDLEKIRFLVF